MPLVGPNFHPQSQLQGSSGNGMFSFPGSAVPEGVLGKGCMNAEGQFTPSVLSVSGVRHSVSALGWLVSPGKRPNPTPEGQVCGSVLRLYHLPLLTGVN